ncbi:MAG: RnfH family protein [bacterium]
MTKKKIKIEVSFAMPEHQELLELEVPENTSLFEAAKLSGIEACYKELELNENTLLGVFGKKRKHDELIREGDRVEIYRPLIADPKESRRKKAQKEKEQ